MAPPNPPTPDPHDGFSARDLVAIVLVGAVLGVGFNALQLDADPSRGLTWVRGERALATLELEPPVPAPAIVPGANAAPAPASHAGVASPRPEAPARPPATPPAPARAGAQEPRPASPAPAASSPPAPATAPPGAATPAADLLAIPESREPREAGLDLVRRLHDAGGALILDARPAGEYAEGHIPGALNLPFDDVFKDPGLLKSVDPAGRAIVTYCGGGDCELSRSLAFSLIDAGQRRVLVFSGGLPAWQSAGLDVRRGSRP